MIKDLAVRFYWVVGRNGFLRKKYLRWVAALEGGPSLSPTLRRIFKRYHDVEIGMYSFGGCFVPGQVDRHTTIGRYCSIAMTCRVMNRNHPMNYKSSHAYFFNPVWGYVKEDVNKHIPLAIGNDVWLGHGCMIMPNVRSIGNGAVVGAGAVVNKDVPPYAVMVGNPARVVRFRFSHERIRILEEEKWWEKSMEEILPSLDEYTRPLEEEGGSE